MTKGKRLVLLFYFASLALICSYVPWLVYLPSEKLPKVLSSQYAWIWHNYSRMPWNTSYYPVAGIAVERLTFEIISLTATALFLYVLVTLYDKGEP